MPFTSKVAFIMKEKGITYDELQFLTNLSPATIASARKTRIGSCSLNTLEKIAHALNLNVKDLFEHHPTGRHDKTST
ncbi:MAG: helix-turn-helix transcriptional regulator [Desulfovibrionaceae bacterium]